MTDFKYSTDPMAVLGAQGFTSASAEELRVLLAIIATGGEVTDAEGLASLSGVSKPRALAALALWEGEGVITKVDADAPNVTEEFPERLLKNEITERTSLKVAEDIRRGSLSTMLTELTEMMSEVTLPTQDIKRITALYSEYSLTEEYILTLAAYLKSAGKLTVTRLVNEAIKLSSKSIDTLEALEGYVSEKTKETGDEWEIRRILGIYGTISPAEREMFKKWTVEFGYGAPVITVAFNISRMRNVKAPLPYMDKLLSDWHAAGLKTKEDCEASAEAHSKQNEAQRAPAVKRRRMEAPTPKYGNFNAEDAFKKALSRSYGETDDKK